MVSMAGRNRCRSMSHQFNNGAPLVQSRSIGWPCDESVGQRRSSTTTAGGAAAIRGGVSWMNTVKMMADKVKDKDSTTINNGGMVDRILSPIKSTSRQLITSALNLDEEPDIVEEFIVEEPPDEDEDDVENPVVITTTIVSPSGDTKTTTTATRTTRTYAKEENGQRTSIVQNTQRRVMVAKSRTETSGELIIPTSDDEITGGGGVGAGDGWMVNGGGLQRPRTPSQPSSALLASSSIAVVGRPPPRSVSSVDPVGQFQAASSPDMDMAIEATLKKTMENFQRMVEKEREQLVQLFPKLATSRLTASADQKPATEVITERRVESDGTVVEVQRVVTRQVVHVHKSVSMVNGVIRNTSARAVVEYQGPKGGYRVKIEDADQTPDVDSETEEDDDGDRASIAPSEFSDTDSVMAVRQRRRSSSSAKKHAVVLTSSQSMSSAVVPVCGSGDSTTALLTLQTSPKRKAEKAWYAAQELVESERRYVEKLHLLDQVFRTRVQKDPETSKTIGNDKLSKLFSNIGSLYTLHKDHLLPQLEVRLNEWQSKQKISDVMRFMAPFLKIYSEYTSNYKKATKTFEELRKRNKRFSMIIDEIEKTPECDHLPLSNHIICPIQRVTRYHLLMTEYLKNLHDGHPDKEDTSQALELTKKAAAHANDMMRQLDKYKHVIEVQEMLGTQIHELLTPSRELIKKGALMKISARDGVHQQRYVFLFNDMMLLCSDRRNVVISALGSKYKLRAIFEVGTMHVLEGDNLEVENTFYVRSGNKTVELYPPSAREKSEWMESLWSMIQDYQQRRQSFRKSDDMGSTDADNSPEPPSSPTTLTTAAIAPQVPLATGGGQPTANGGAKCSTCQSGFNAFKKSYVCKSCGGTFCKKCCPKKIKLADGEKEQRVCVPCYVKVKTQSIGGGQATTISPTPSTNESPEHRAIAAVSSPPLSPVGNGSIAQQREKTTTSVTTTTVVATAVVTTPSPEKSQRITRKSILEVKPSDSCILSGYLDIRAANRKSWEKRYFALHEDFVLYTFKGENDISARTSMPITGCKIGLVDQRQDSSISNKDLNAFKLEHKRRTYYFKAPNPEYMAKWVAALDLASQAQFPASSS